MTALAMIIGMAPMALGLGEGGEQNAPLGRAVIGGLIFATIATLMFVPVVFSMVHKKQQPAPEAGSPEPPASRRRLGLAAVIGLCAAGAIVVTGIMARARTDTALKTWTDEQAIPSVAVAPPDARVLSATLDLPGRLEAYAL
eukprot:gene59842-81866_t